ncbi:class I SAM-dependent methyltransferase [Pelagibacterium sp. 26DY04]|uniref:class I SAM-dependent methyltransferase n=1 Tax=Pelagibacterium sp. 26DY04 TaxID=2967130 RepID=UPI0028162888|nr:class I SAM-dependent methyltransferase [Pelagibacterium sp. 26DY04]WMT88170.1 class I SAM-dependent methyltransferase [Pelagibacterium sp. 26DY04]
MSQGAIEGYASAAPELIDRYGDIDPEAHLAPVRAFLPPMPATIIDIGAGIGTEARWLDAQGHSVVAVEPVAAFREAAGRMPGNVKWRDDRLPELPAVMAEGRAYDLVLALAMLQHLSPPDQIRSIDTLYRLATPGGRLILSLRHGPGHPDRKVHDIDVDAILDAAACAGLVLLSRQAAGSLQKANRAAGVVWTWLVFDR